MLKLKVCCSQNASESSIGELIIISSEGDFYKTRRKPLGLIFAS